MTNQEQVIADIAREVVARLRTQLQQTAGGFDARLELRRSPAAPRAMACLRRWMRPRTRRTLRRRRLQEMSLEDRGRMIKIVRRICIDRCEELGKMELEESKVGRLDHKIQKLKNMQYVLGVEAMRSDARSDTSGLLPD